MTATDGDFLSQLTAFAAQAVLVQWVFGTLMVLMTGLALKRARKLNAATRHAVWVAVLLVTAAAPLMTVLTSEIQSGAGQGPLAKIVQTGPGDTGAHARGITKDDLHAATLSRAVPPGKPILPGQLKGAVTGFLCFLWLGLAVHSLIRLVISLHNLRTLRDRSLLADRKDDQLLRSLAKRAALEDVPSLRELAEVTSPAAIGCLNPWVAVPTSWPCELSPTAQGHVLLHELAHVVRRDGTVEVLCRIAEALLPLHPAKSWLREQIDVERESACDDWAAVHAGVSPRQYAHSILDCATQSLPHHNRLALAFGHRASQLRKRVQNIMSPNRTHRIQLRRAPTAAAFLLLIFGTLASASAWPPVPTAVPQATIALTGIFAGQPESVSADDSALFRAMDRGAWQAVSEMIDEGREVNQIWPGDGSPLIMAARSGRIDIARQLLERGAEVDLAVGGDGSPLIQAAARGDLEMAELFLSYGADIDAHGPGGDGNPLIEASKSGQRDMTDYLLQRGAAINLHIDGDDTPLINAVQQGHLTVVQFLLDNGADPNLEGDVDGRSGIVRTPLNQAVAARESAIESVLRGAGATN